MRTTDLPAPFLAPYTAAQRRFATVAWPMRAAEELRSARIFRALAHAARVVSLPEPWPARFASAVHDEVRHARLCATVGASLGAPVPKYDARPVRTRLAGVPEPLARLLSLLLIEIAMGETISMYLFRAGRRAAIEPLTRAALSSIVGDEVRHQRLGWQGLAFLWSTLDESMRAFLQSEAARGLAMCEQQTARPAMVWLHGTLLARFILPSEARCGASPTRRHGRPRTLRRTRSAPRASPRRPEAHLRSGSRRRTRRSRLEAGGGNALPDPSRPRTERLSAVTRGERRETRLHGDEQRASCARARPGESARSFR